MDIRDLGDLAAYAQQQVERIQRMQADLSSQVGEAVSPRGHVHATTGPGGALQELRIESDAMRLSSSDLAAEVTAAVTAAQQQYAAHADQIMEPLLGMRPSEESIAELERGASRLDTLAADLDRLARQRGLD